MTNDVDTLATALCATTDDILKEHPDLAPWRPPVGITPRLSDAELVTLATMQAILGCTSEAKWLRPARAHLRHLFPCLPQQPGCNKRLRRAAGPIRSVNLILATTSVWSDDVWVVDSTPLECGRSRETVKRSNLAGWAELESHGKHRCSTKAVRCLPRTQARSGPGPLRGPVLARPAPPRHPRDRRPRVSHRTASGPKSTWTALTLYQILGTLQDILRCWTGTCTTCHQPLPSRPHTTSRQT